MSANAPNDKRPQRPLPKFKKNKAPAASTPVPAPAASSSTSTAPAPSPTPSTSDDMPKIQLPSGMSAAGRWTDDTIIVAYGTTYLPPDPLLSDGAPVTVGQDGLWRDREWAREPQPLDHFSVHAGFMEVPSPEAAEHSPLFRLPREGDRERFFEKIEIDPVTKKGHTVLVRRDNIFALKEDVHNELRKRVLSLTSLFDFSASLYRLTTTPGGREALARLDKVTQEVIAHTNIPTEQAKYMRILCHVLRFGEIKSRVEWIACTRAFQRCALDISAFVDCTGAILPDDLAPDAAPLLTLIRDRRKKHDNTPGISRRGTILSGTDVEKYHQLFIRLGIPVYVYALHAQLAIPDDILAPLSAPRCNNTYCEKLSTFNQSELPPVCHAPQHTHWRHFERVARGLLARPEEDELPKPSERYIALKAKAEQQDSVKKKRRLDAAAKEAERSAAFAQAHPNMTTSLEMYRSVAWRAPALRNYFDHQNKTRLLFAPQPLTPFTTGLQRALKMIGLADGSWKRKTFIPDVDQFAYVQALRAARNIVMAVWLMPTLLRRIELSRTDTAVLQYGSEDWRVLLGGEHFIRRAPVVAGQKLTWEHFWADPSKYWKYGGETLWGKAESDRLQSDGARPDLGVLPCGHSPTVEDVLGNPHLAESILFSIGQLGLLQALAFIAKPSDLQHEHVTLVNEPTEARTYNGVDAKRLAGSGTATRKNPMHVFIHDYSDSKADVPRLFTHRAPTVAQFDNARDRTVLGMIRQSVLCTGRVADRGLWPAVWSADSYEFKERCAWLLAYRNFLVECAYAQELDKKMANKPGWLKVPELRELWYPASLNDPQQRQLEQHLHERYCLTSFQCGRMAVPFYQEPSAGSVHARCSACGTAVLPAGVEYTDWDLEDE